MKDGMLWLENQSEEKQLMRLMEMNRRTGQFGLTLTEEEVGMLMERRGEALKKERRVEFGEGILPKLLFHFCDSAYIEQETYAETIARLQEIFYLYKNETLDKVPDDELLQFMREQFEEVCCGDLDYLESDSLDKIVQITRKGKCSGRGIREEEQDEW